MMRMNKTEFKKYCTDYAYLYVIKLTSETETFYKIGITSNIDIHKRIEYYKKYYNYKIIAVYQHTSSDLIMDIERLLIDSFDRYEPNIKFGGSSECVKTIFGINKIFSSLKWIKDLKKIDIIKKQEIKQKGNFAKLTRQYLISLSHISNKNQNDSEYEYHKQMAADLSADPKLGTLMEYINIFGIDRDLAQMSDATLSENRLRKSIENHNINQLLKTRIPNMFEVGETYLTKQIKNKLESIYISLGIENKKVSTGDLNLIFETKVTTQNKQSALKIIERK